MAQFSVVLARRVDRFVEAANFDEVGTTPRRCCHSIGRGRCYKRIESERERRSRKQFDELAQKGWQLCGEESLKARPLRASSSVSDFVCSMGRDGGGDEAVRSPDCQVHDPRVVARDDIAIGEDEIVALSTMMARFLVFILP